MGFSMKFPDLSQFENRTRTFSRISAHLKINIKRRFFHRKNPSAQLSEGFQWWNETSARTAENKLFDLPLKMITYDICAMPREYIPSYWGAKHTELVTLRAIPLKFGLQIPVMYSIHHLPDSTFLLYSFNHYLHSFWYYRYVHNEEMNMARSPSMFLIFA